MELRIGSRKIDLYNAVSVTLPYDAVASTFGFQYYFDPENADHRELFRPAQYKTVTVYHQGELLLTGTLLNHSFEDGPERTLVSVSGYSKSGVLEDCEIPQSVYPIQSNGLNLEQIARQVAKPFGVGVRVAPAVAKACSVALKGVLAKNGQSAKEFLTELAGQRHVMVSHDEQGNLLLTEANTTQPPVQHFEKGMPGLRMGLTFEGQRMHSGVTMIKSQTKGRKDGTHKKGNAGKASYDNPYVPASVVRPRVNRQTSARTIDTDMAARNMLSDELRGLPLSIQMEGWQLGGKLARPDQIITVTNPAMQIYTPTRFYVAAVDLAGDHESETCTLTCVLPSVFGREAPKNIFS